MAKRPAMLSDAVFLASLREQGCIPVYEEAYLSDCKLLVPLLVREVGEKRFLELTMQCREELGLKPTDTYWPQSVRYIVGWATRAIEDYKASKVNSR